MIRYNTKESEVISNQATTLEQFVEQTKEVLPEAHAPFINALLYIAKDKIGDNRYADIIYRIVEQTGEKVKAQVQLRFLQKGGKEMEGDDFPYVNDKDLPIVRFMDDGKDKAIVCPTMQTPFNLRKETLGDAIKEYDKLCHCHVMTMSDNQTLAEIEYPALIETLQRLQEKHGYKIHGIISYGEKGTFIGLNRDEKEFIFIDIDAQNKWKLSITTAYSKGAEDFRAVMSEIIAERDAKTKEISQKAK